MNAPILSIMELKAICGKYHKQGTAISLCTGCFDLLHRGHIYLLEKAAELGVLFVGINSDHSVRQLKGTSRPVNKQKDRAYLLSALRCVEIVFIIEETNVCSALNIVMPQYWIKGGDYTMETLNPDEVQTARRNSTEIVLLPLTDGYSTTAILEKL